MTVSTGYRFRKFTPAQERAIAHAHARGASARALAESYGVTSRTIYRVVRRALEPTLAAVLGDYSAEFRLEDGYPVQVTPWVPRA